MSLTVMATFTEKRGRICNCDSRLLISSVKSSKGTKLLVKCLNFKIRSNENYFEWFKDYLWPITVMATFYGKRGRICNYASRRLISHVKSSKGTIMLVKGVNFNIRIRENDFE